MGESKSTIILHDYITKISCIPSISISHSKCDNSLKMKYRCDQVNFISYDDILPCNHRVSITIILDLQCLLGIVISWLVKDEVSPQFSGHFFYLLDYITLHYWDL